uniref:Peptidase S59 domain-containing protein n=1 Tax=Araucaria cunninghamii TaxID=56994 RepID=A0A0D6QTQ4_ARACU
MAIPVDNHGNMAEDINGTTMYENPFTQETENSKENWPSNVEDANLQNSSPTSKLVDASVKSTSRQNGLNEEHNHRGNGYISISGHRAGEAAIVYEHGADIEALMPKLRHSDYYTEPKIQELAAKERAEPGYCRRVKDFVVGRKGYGSVKFFGETDVRRLDLESIIQFNKCEVLVYMDESKKPPPGQGLNKPAEITLLNVKCVDKKTGQHYTEGPEVEKFERRLKKKTEEQGAEFVLYSASKGEWKFRVKHFSKYGLDDCGLEVGENMERMLEREAKELGLELCHIVMFKEIKSSVDESGLEETLSNY